MANSTPMRLQHVGITVPPEEIEAARAFYGGLLDLPEFYASERALVYGLGRPGDLELHVIAGKPADAEADHHFALEVADLSAPRALLEGAGHVVEEARPVGGRQRFFVRDPFGNLIELVTPRAT
jgi:catechol 2,3-dioxygenase-like lactoylglutathione lyase family enzyme